MQWVAQAEHRGQFPVSCLSHSTRSALWQRFLLALPQPGLALREFESQKVTGGHKWQSMSWRQTGEEFTPAQADFSNFCTNWPPEQAACSAHGLAANLGSAGTSLIYISWSLHYKYEKRLWTKPKNDATVGCFLFCQTKPEPLFWRFCLI